MNGLLKRAAGSRQRLEMIYINRNNQLLYFITVSENRKRKLVSALKGVRAEVLTFGEIR